MTYLQAAAEEIADMALELLSPATGWERDKLREDVRRRAEAIIELLPNADDLLDFSE